MCFILSEVNHYMDNLAEQCIGQDARKYDSRDGIGRVESGTETENNAEVVRGAIAEGSYAWQAINCPQDSSFIRTDSC